MKTDKEGGENEERAENDNVKVEEEFLEQEVKE